MDTPGSEAPVRSPWHAGELAAQARVGVSERMAQVGPRTIRPFMPDQHRLFFASLPFLVVGSVDQEGWPWASLLSGAPGFVTSPDPTTLHVAAWPLPGDPLAGVLAPSAAVGLLGIELPTRRRNRANGRMVGVDESGFTVAVEQSFGNCPKYIQLRDYVHAVTAPTAVPVEPFSDLADDARRLIGNSDTCFVASYAPAEGPKRAVDVSHRGGPPGFLRLASDGAIEVPDYSGNHYFNTLGNLVANPRAGLLLVDFANGDLLQVTGRASIVWEGEEVRALPGAERLWRLTPTHGRWLRGALPLRFAFRELQPHLPATETWRETSSGVT